MKDYIALYILAIQEMNTSLDMKKAQRAYGESVRSFRLKSRLSQEALALDAGLNRTHMYKLEAGMVNPTLFTMLRICEVLGVSFGHFAGRVERNLRRNRKQ